MWDLPRSGIETVSPALEGGFFTTEPPGKPHKCLVSRMNIKIYGTVEYVFWPRRLGAESKSTRV